MRPLVAIVAQGAMASGLAARLTQHGVTVLTTLDGRSSASQARAAAAGMQAVALPRLLEAEILLAILPPGAALGFATQLAPALRSAPSKPLYVDCNAVSPATAHSIAQVVRSSGCPFADAGIIGLPPKEGYAGPHLYASGADAPRLLVLRESGLDVRVLNGDVGEASALKMSYGGITKGLTAVASAMMLAAVRAGLGEALRSEFAESEPVLYASLARRVPDMLSKAYRWIDEMRQIQAYAAEDHAASEIFGGVARFYERMAQDFACEQRESAALQKFFKE